MLHRSPPKCLDTRTVRQVVEEVKVRLVEFAPVIAPHLLWGTDAGGTFAEA
jgi:hypothetical protein